MAIVTKRNTALAAVLAAGLGAAVPVIQHYEGKRNAAYLDPVDIPTICYGHTGGVKLGQRLSDEQCLELLAEDMLEAAESVTRCVTKPMTDHQRAAFVSFAFNVGGSKFCRSTLARKASAGDINGACNELPKWVYAGGKKLPGLVKRRNAEQAVCLGREPTL